MRTISLSEGTVFYKDNAQHRLLRSFGENWQVEEIQTGKISNMRTNDLLDRYMDKSITFPHPINVDSKKGEARKQSILFGDLDIEVQNTLRNRKAFLEMHIRTNQFNFNIRNIEDSLNKYWLPEFGSKPCSKTALNWALEYFNNGKDILSLLSADSLKGNRKPRFRPEITKIFNEVIDSEYLTMKRISVTTAYRIAKGKIEELNANSPITFHLEIPSIKYFKRLIYARPAFDVCVAREGKERARVKFRNAVHSVNPQYPLHIVQIDHSQLDIDLVAENGAPLGRPWLTLVSDLYTRSILGFHITFSAPSQHSLASALFKAILPKSQLKNEHPNVHGDYSMYGIPSIVIVDNGFEFHSSHFEEFCFSLGITIWYTPRKTPWWKANIESTLGTLNSNLTERLPGKTFNSITKKGDYNPVKKASVKLTKFTKSLVKWIVDVYHERPHSTTGMTPKALWDKKIQSVDIFLPEDLEKAYLLVLEKHQRKAWQYGIDVNHIRYNNQALGDLRKLHGVTLHVNIRRDKFDLGHIYVETPEGNFLKVEAIDSFKHYATGLTEHQHEVHKKYLAQNELTVSTKNLALASEEVYRLSVDETNYSRKKNNMRKYRFEENHPQSKVGVARVEPLENTPHFEKPIEDLEIPDFDDFVSY